MAQNSNFHVATIQESLRRPRPLVPDNLEILSSSILGARDFHKLYELDMDMVNSFIHWSTNNLERAEVDHLTRRIKYQKIYYNHWNVWGIDNARLFLTKTAESCYCDPFTPEPKLYDGHISFSSDAEKDGVFRGSGYEELLPGRYTSDKCYIGKLRFKIDPAKPELSVKMNRKLWSPYTQKYKIEIGKIERFRLLLGFLSTRQIVPVNPEKEPRGRIWHSYSLREFVDKANSDDRIFYQMNPQKVVVAGSLASSSSS